MNDKPAPEPGRKPRPNAGQQAYRATFVLGMALFGAAFVGGTGYVLATKGRLPEVSAQHLTQATEAMARGDLAGADREYRMASRIDPTDDVSARKATELQQRLGEKAAEIGFYTRQRDLQPSNPATHRNLAQVLYNAARYDEAVASYEAAIRLQPADARAWAGIGSVRLDQDRLAEAGQAFQGALARSPGDATIHNNLGIVAAMSGRKTEAVGHFEEAERLKPGVYTANLERARAELAAARPPP